MPYFSLDFQSSFSKAFFWIQRNISVENTLIFPCINSQQSLRTKGYSVHKISREVSFDISYIRLFTFETEQRVSTGLHNPRIVLIKLQPCLASSHWLDSTLALSGKRSLVIGQTAVLSDKLSLTSCSLIQQLCIVAIIHFISLRAKSFSGPSEIYMRIYFT